MENEKKIINENGSLMKKTKAQLVEIILRKDEVEKTIREELKIAVDDASQKCEDYNAITEIYNKCAEDLAEIDNEYSKLKNAYSEQCDEYASERQELIDKVNRYKTLFCLSLTFALMLGIHIIL